MLLSLLARRHGRFLLQAALCVLVVLLAVPVFMRMAVAGRLYADPALVPSAEVVIIPGASVVRGVPSEVLAERLAAGVALYRAGTARRILITGDNGERNYDEVTAMLDTLLSQGVPPRDIFLDRAGFDTYSSMYRARFVYGARRAIIVTQDFHLPRAVFIARIFGIDAAGLVAPGGRLFDYLREIPASWKALFETALGRQPAHIGMPIPLSGAGNAARIR